MVGGLIELCHEAFYSLKANGVEFERLDGYFGK